jgi:hypothetical protein
MAKKKGITQSQDTGSQKPKAGNPWGHYRAKLIHRGEATVLCGPSNNTVGDLQSDYKPLSWSLRELEQYISQKRSQKVEPSLDDVKRDFCGQHILVGDGAAPGYATDSDLNEFLNTNPAPVKFAKELMARRWNLTLSTIETDLKPHRKKK